MTTKYSRRNVIKSAAATVALMGMPDVLESQAPGEGTTRFNYAPKSRNVPLSTARGYLQNGKPVTSLGVFEHWKNDTDRQYSRNLEPANGRGIELIYLRIS